MTQKPPGFQHCKRKRHLHLSIKNEKKTLLLLLLLRALYALANNPTMRKMLKKNSQAMEQLKVKV